MLIFVITAVIAVNHEVSERLLKRLQGEWVVESHIYDGHFNMGHFDIFPAPMTVIVEGRQARLKYGFLKCNFSVRCEVDQSAKLVKLILNPKTCLSGRYFLNGDYLLIAVSTNINSVAPLSFDASVGSDVSIFVFKRKRSRLVKPGK